MASTCDPSGVTTFTVWANRRPPELPHSPNPPVASNFFPTSLESTFTNWLTRSLLPHWLHTSLSLYIFIQDWRIKALRRRKMYCRLYVGFPSRCFYLCSHSTKSSMADLLIICVWFCVCVCGKIIIQSLQENTKLLCEFMLVVCVFSFWVMGCRKSHELVIVVGVVEFYKLTGCRWAKWIRCMTHAVEWQSVSNSIWELFGLFTSKRMDAIYHRAFYTYTKTNNKKSHNVCYKCALAGLWVLCINITINHIINFEQLLLNAA